MSETGAKCEGVVVPGLAKVRKYKMANKDPDASDGEEKKSEMDDEEYILGKLLKKSVLNGAMKHDTIVDACELCGRGLLTLASVLMLINFIRDCQATQIMPSWKLRLIRLPSRLLTT